MPSPLGVVKGNAPYAYLVAGLIWLVVVYATGSVLLLWPVVACLLGGLLLRMMPGRRLTWAWATAAATMGLLLALYQAYTAAPLVFGSFSTIAGASLVAFGVFAVVHLILLYAANSKTE